MTVRAKMNTLIAIICVLVVGLTASIIGVVAATNQTVNPAIRVEYHADTVSAVVAATYQCEGDNGSTSMRSAKDNSTAIAFLATDGAHPEAFTMDSVELNAQNKTYILFSYHFINNNQTNDLLIRLNDYAERSNVYVIYSDSDQLESNSFSNIVYEMHNDFHRGAGLRTKTTDSRENSITCATYAPDTNQTTHEKTIYVLVEIKNYDAKAYYRTSGSSWTISFTLQNVSVA